MFSHLHLSINSGDKIALTGNNGCGKSTLMRILAGDLSPSSGTVLRPEHLYYVPQHFGQYDRQTIAQALGISHKLSALHAILSGDATEKHFNTLNDDWNVEERAQASLDSWGLDGITLSRPMDQTDERRRIVRKSEVIGRTRPFPGRTEIHRSSRYSDRQDPLSLHGFPIDRLSIATRRPCPQQCSPV